MSRVAVFGAGYVGLVTGACFAELGHDVVVRDVLPERIERLRARRGADLRAGARRAAAPERGAAHLHARRRRGRRRAPTSSTSPSARRRPTRATPTSRRSGPSSTSSPALEGRPVLVMKSTVPVGTGARVRHRLDERGLEHVGYVSNPEFTAEGTAIRDFQHPDRIVIGSFDAGGRRRRRGAAPRASTRRSCAATSPRPR